MRQRLADQSYYEILEISRDAPEHEIHQAYQRAKETYSPDSPALYSMFSPDEARELMALIEEAYRVLGDRARRLDYNQSLSQTKNSSAEALPDLALQSSRPPEVSKFSNVKPLRSNQAPSAFQESSSPSPRSRKDPIPAGFARTMFGIYEVNADFENEIRDQEEFDGAFVQRIRLYKNVSLDQLSAETRIGRTYLAALEANNFSALPAPVFVRGFVVQVARALHLDDQKVANSYMKIFKKG